MGRGEHGSRFKDSFLVTIYTLTYEVVTPEDLITFHTGTYKLLCLYYKMLIINSYTSRSTKHMN